MVVATFRRVICGSILVWAVPLRRKLWKSDGPSDCSRSFTMSEPVGPMSSKKDATSWVFSSSRAKALASLPTSNEKSHTAFSVFIAVWLLPRITGGKGAEGCSASCRTVLVAETKSRPVACKRNCICPRKIARPAGKTPSLSSSSMFEPRIERL